MKACYSLVFVVLFALCVGSCGSKRPETTPPTDEDAQAEQAAEEEKKKLVSAEQRIRQWLGGELTKKVGILGKELGGSLSTGLSQNPEVAAQSRSLTKAVFEDKEVKARLDKISDEATKGFTNKLKLGWRVIRAGGVDKFKQKIKADTQKVAVKVLSEYIQTTVLKDPRTAAMLKDVSPALKVQAKVAAVAVEENLSPRVTKTILGIALKISAAGDKEEMATRVEAWIQGCQETANVEVEKFMRGVGELDSLDVAIQGLVAEVLGHETTKRELTVMMKNLTEDPEVNKALIKVYNTATFEKGEAAMRAELERVLALPATDRELFAALQRLSASPGATGIINQHASQVSQDPKMAKLIEEFFVNLLESCGDPTTGA